MNNAAKKRVLIEAWFGGTVFWVALSLLDRGWGPRTGYLIFPGLVLWTGLGLLFNRSPHER
jgi:hypothetical protein